MPLHWYIDKENVIKEEDNDEIRAKKALNHLLCASKKPYFFAYNYQSLKAEYDEIMQNINSKLVNMFKKTYKEMKNSTNLTENEQKMLDLCTKRINLDLSPSTMNRICWAVEDNFDGVDLFNDVNFDYSIYKSNVDYSIITYNQIRDLCEDYLKKLRQINKKRVIEEQDDEEYYSDKEQMIMLLSEKCEEICSNNKELCDILLDLCYIEGLNKNIVWNICSNTIVDNLLEKNNFLLTYPEKSSNGDFDCCGYSFINKTIKIGDDNND